MEIQSPIQVPDGMGGMTTTWTTIATVWCGISPLRGDELVEAMQTNANITGKITMRYRTDLKMSYRGKMGIRIFDFKASVNPNDARKTIEVLYTEQVL
jgi:SPP1 family predicted phage head-tail adaptor